MTEHNNVKSPFFKVKTVPEQNNLNWKRSKASLTEDRLWLSASWCHCMHLYNNYRSKPSMFLAATTESGRNICALLWSRGVKHKAHGSELAQQWLQSGPLFGKCKGGHTFNCIFVNFTADENCTQSLSYYTQVREKQLNNRIDNRNLCFYNVFTIK